MGKNTVSAITRGTTPPIVLNVTNRTFDGCTVYVTIKETPSKNVLKDEELVEITKTGDDLIITPYCSHSRGNFEVSRRRKS